MALDAYRKIGRGGAGNFYSKHDLDKVTDKINEVFRLSKSMMYLIKYIGR